MLHTGINGFGAAKRPSGGVFDLGAEPLSDCHRHERASITNEIFILPNVRIIGALALAAGVFLWVRARGRVGAQYIQPGGQERQKESADLSIAKLVSTKLWLNPFDGFAIEDYACIKSAWEEFASSVEPNSQFNSSLQSFWFGFICCTELLFQFIF